MNEKQHITAVLRKDLRLLTRDTRRESVFLEKIKGIADLTSHMASAIWHIENLGDHQFGFTDTLGIALRKGALMGKTARKEERYFLLRILDSMYFSNRAIYLIAGEIICDRIRKEESQYYNEKQ